MPEADPIATLVRQYRRSMDEIDARMGVMQGRGADRTAEYIGIQLDAVQREVRRLEGLAEGWSQQVMADQYKGSAAVANTTLQRAGILLNPRFTGMDRRALRALTERVSDDLVYIKDALVEGLALGFPQRWGAQAVESALKHDNQLVRFKDGRTSVRVPSGKFWRPEVYSKMLARTAVADARRVSFDQRYLANGVDLVKVVANGSVHDVCARWEGETLSLTGNTPGYPTVAEARATGLFHPNCRHRYVVDTSKPQPPLPEELTIPRVAEPRPILGLAARVMPPPRKTRRPRRRPKAAAPSLPKARGSFDPAQEFDPGAHEKLSEMVRWSAKGASYDPLGRKRRHPLGQRKAVKAYTGAGYTTMNSVLRNPDPGQAAMGMRAQYGGIPVGTHVKHLDDAIAKAPKLAAELVVYRGVKGKHPERFNNFEPGTVFKDSGYSSWSGNRATGVYFGETGGVLMRMRAAKGRKGALYVGPDEHELLFKRGASYRIVDVEDRVDTLKGYVQKVVTVELVED